MLLITNIGEDVLIGGNLESLIALLGTPYQPIFKDSILLIEEVGCFQFPHNQRLS